MVVVPADQAAHQRRVRVAARHRRRRRHGLRVVNQVHDDGAGAMGARVLGEVVGARELLATVAALEGLVMGVERPVVALEVLLAAEPAVADVADEGLGRVLGQGLLASAAAGGSREGRRVDILGARVGLGVVLGLGRIAAGALLVGRRGLGLGAARLRVGGGAHGDVARVPLALVPVGVAVLARVGGAKEAVGAKSVTGPKVFLVAAEVAGSAERQCVRARARSADLNNGAVVQIDQAVDKVVLRIEIGEGVE